jgi:hypothetical protein
MSYDKHHADLHVALKEFERLTGTGNVKSANSTMVKIVRHLVQMVEWSRTDSVTPQVDTTPVAKVCACGGSCNGSCGGACGGNCQCGTVMPEVVAPAPVEPVAEAVINPEPVADIVPVVAPEPVVEHIAEPVAEPVPEPVVDPVEPHAETPAEPETEVTDVFDVAETETAPKARKGKKSV